MLKLMKLLVPMLLLALLPLIHVPEVFAAPDVRTSPSPDKQYFALRAVASVQRQLVFNLKGLSPEEAITDVNLQLDALEKLIAKEDIDRDILQILKDVRALTRAYLEYGRLMNVIDEETLEKLNQRMGLGERFVVALGTAGAGAFIEPFSGSVFGFLAGFFLGEFYEEISRQQQSGKISEERWNKIQAAKSDLEKHMQEDYLEHQKLTRKLTAKYRWKAGEAGLDATPEEVAGFHRPLVSESKTIEMGVLDERIRGLSAWMARRPRDPFTRLEYVLSSSNRECIKKGNTPAEMQDAAKRLLDLARLARGGLDHIPAGERYDLYRVQVLVVAGESASSAAAFDVLAGGKGMFGGPSRFAHQAVGLWQEALTYSYKVDPKGYLRMRLAFALIQDGEAKKGYQLAEEVANLRKDERDPQFACNYARLKAIAGDNESAISWMEFSVKSCKVDPREFKDDPHLSQVKKDRPSRFAALSANRP